MLYIATNLHPTYAGSLATLINNRRGHISLSLNEGCYDDLDYSHHSIAMDTFKRILVQGEHCGSAEPILWLSTSMVLCRVLPYLVKKSGG